MSPIGRIPNHTGYIYNIHNSIHLQQAQTQLILKYQYYFIFLTKAEGMLFKYA